MADKKQKKKNVTIRSPSRTPARTPTNIEDIKVEPGYKPRLTEEEQDLAYELRAQLMRNIEEQNQRIKTELELHDKMKNLKAKKEWQRDAKKESELIRLNAIKCMKLFERKYKEASDKLNDTDLELKKSQKLTTDYKDLYEAECSKSGAKPHVLQSAPPRPPFKSTTAIRPEDIVRKNEFLVQENSHLRIEIHKLKLDNIDLIKKVKVAETHAITVTNHYATSQTDRVALQRRLSKEKESHNNLSKSMTKQASDWLQTKKQYQQLEEESRCQGTVSLDVLGGEKRFFKHQATKNVFRPKKMLPVNQWAQANQTTV